MKTVKVDHVILTLGFDLAAISNGQGRPKAEVDKMINDRLAEGFDEVEVIPLKTNFNDNMQVYSVVNEYIFRAYEKEPAVKTAKKADA